MSKNNSIKNHIKESFLNGATASDLVKMFTSISKSTIYKWIREEKWEDEKAKSEKQIAKSPVILLDMLNKMIEGLPELVADPKAIAQAADSIVKIIKSIKTLYKDKDVLAQALFITSDMALFLNDNSDRFQEEFRIKFADFLESYQNHCITKYSPKNFT